ncbi:Hypothetical predicted protein [Octopus vulgaris]|uniref:Uncharacterized protein n=1 Tax=Octopus vulgaris TaxID=6645 RepID=A0AA36EXR9_OCTVU|nr:Hypothetical predicted protein [Octopus vulgaris]
MDGFVNLHNCHKWAGEDPRIISEKMQNRPKPNLTGTNQPVLYPRTKTQELESGKKKGESQKEKLLELKLKFADQSLKNMLEQEKHQLEIGVRLREEIKSYERNCWENASCSLRKFQRLETGIIKIQRNFTKDIEQEKKLLEEVKRKREFQIKGKPFNILFCGHQPQFYPISSPVYRVGLLN